jgi:carbamoyltransferase
MGAAAYGDPARFARKMEQLLMWDEELGEWILDTRFIEHSNMKRAGYLNERLIEFIGMPVRYDDSDLTQVHYDFASSAQAVFEKRIFQILNFYARKTGERNLCASGGCFMNSLANGKIIQNTPIENIFIPYAAADNGGAMGAALHVWHYVLNKPRLPHQYPPTPFLGPEYSDEHIEAVLRRFNLPVRKLSNPPKHAALAIAEGRLVGWFQGRMEFGERALGNRSILADPRVPEMKDKINAAVKYREAFRPFAPSVLSERVSDFFQIPSNVIVPYMEQVYPIRVQKRGLIPAVVHADGTGRLQTVDRQINPKYYELIRQFDIITGVPLVLNTSFNVKGEPIVCSPEDAVRTFFSCGLDILLIGSFLISKKTINHGIEDATT